MDAYLPYLFVSNIVLTLIDATIGYCAAPTLVRLGGGDEDGVEWATRGVRKLLAAVVALYMFFNCLAFFDKKPMLAVVVTSVILLDIVVQLMLGRRLKDRQKP